jgi:uncharacterized protein YjbJ (UPF0337 family)
MNLLKINESRNELRSNLRQKFDNLTDDDLRFAKGKEKELWGRMQNNRGKAKEELRKIISKL